MWAEFSLTPMSTLFGRFDETLEPGMLGFESAIVVLACLKAGSALQYLAFDSISLISPIGRPFDRSLALKEEVESVTAHWCTLQSSEERKAYIHQRVDFKVAVNLVSDF